MDWVIAVVCIFLSWGCPLLAFLYFPVDKKDEGENHGM